MDATMGRRINIFFGIFLWLTGHFLQAQIFSQLQLRMFDQSAFYVVLDQNTYPVNNSFIASGLFPGNHFLQVYKLGPFKQNATVYAQTPAYSGVIQVGAGVVISALIDEYNNYSIWNSSILTTPSNQDTPGNFQFPSYNGAQNFEYNFKDEALFKAFKNTISLTPFSAKRMLMMRRCIAFQPISSSQIAELMSMLDFENDKLELAKFAYPFAIDKQNYIIVNNAFNFKATSELLAQYLYP